MFTVLIRIEAPSGRWGSRVQVMRILPFCILVNHTPWRMEVCGRACNEQCAQALCYSETRKQGAGPSFCFRAGIPLRGQEAEGGFQRWPPKRVLVVGEVLDGRDPTVTKRFMERWGRPQPRRGFTLAP